MKNMSISFVVLSLLISSLSSTSPSPLTTSQHFGKGSSIYVDKPDQTLISPNGEFSAGFYAVGDNSYCFAIWFININNTKGTVVWMANRDQPVNGEKSKLSLLKNGNLILLDAGKITVWTTNTVSLSSSPVKLRLLNSGNLVLSDGGGRGVLWQSFDSPTDTLLPHQSLTRDSNLVSSRSESDCSSGFYKLFFDNDNVLRLLFTRPGISSIYWPRPWLVSWQAGRDTYNNSNVAFLDSFGEFSSSDNLGFKSADFGLIVQRRLALDSDGNLRLYSRRKKGRETTWHVSWQAFSQPCMIHGVCGPNSFCSYVPNSGRKCSCIPGFKMENVTDWSYGCKPEFESNLSCEQGEFDFVHLPSVDFYGYDRHFLPNYTLEMCMNECLESCSCKGFQYKFDNEHGYYDCYPKLLLTNGYRSPSYEGRGLYLKLRKRNTNYSSYHHNPLIDYKLGCSNSGGLIKQLNRTYIESRENGMMIFKFMLWFACVVGAFEVICILLVWFFLAADHQDYLVVESTGFKRFTYAELKKATRNFSEEIGRGGGGIVYKGVLCDNKVVAIKRLRNEANQGGEAEFLAEASTIGKLNHMNLIEMWGYCVEGKHRFLVYEYMEHGSLADNLYSNNAVDTKKKFEIALGTAKGLAYLHEECLEWVLHCDVKPQNILLDSNYKPKVADFGLSKLLNRSSSNGGRLISTSNFSRIRGTRGYMAPEWVFNLSITSKVDVYSYGVVVLEMVTGKNPTIGVCGNDVGSDKKGVGEGGEGAELRRLVTWAREKINNGVSSWIEEVADHQITIGGEFAPEDASKIELLVQVALQCVEDDRDARPTMSQVVEMLLRHENDYY